MPYVDFFCLPFPKSTPEEVYRKMAVTFSDVMKDFGLLSFCEAIADDVSHGKVTDFYRAVAAKEDETVVAAFYVWPSKEVRDRAWELGMKDPRLSYDAQSMPFDGMRMFWGGFRPLVMS